MLWRWFNYGWRIGHRAAFPALPYPNSLARILGAIFPWQAQMVYELFHPTGYRKNWSDSLEAMPPATDGLTGQATISTAPEPDPHPPTYQRAASVVYPVLETVKEEPAPFNSASGTLPP